MKKLLFLVLGLVVVAPLGCRKNPEPSPKGLREGETIMMPGGFPKGMRPPAKLKKAVEDQEKELKQRRQE
jgi:hypothetical protein